MLRACRWGALIRELSLLRCCLGSAPGGVWWFSVLSSPSCIRSVCASRWARRGGACSWENAGSVVMNQDGSPTSWRCPASFGCSVVAWACFRGCVCFGVVLFFCMVGFFWFVLSCLGLEVRVYLFLGHLALGRVSVHCAPSGLTLRCGELVCVFGWNFSISVLRVRVVCLSLVRVRGGLLGRSTPFSWACLCCVDRWFGLAAPRRSAFGLFLCFGSPVVSASGYCRSRRRFHHRFLCTRDLTCLVVPERVSGSCSVLGQVPGPICPLFFVVYRVRRSPSVWVGSPVCGLVICLAVGRCLSMGGGALVVGVCWAQILMFCVRLTPMAKPSGRLQCSPGPLVVVGPPVLVVRPVGLTHPFGVFVVPVRCALLVPE